MKDSIAGNVRKARAEAPEEATSGSPPFAPEHLRITEEFSITRKEDFHRLFP
jgi:hypothetical protein